MSVIQTTVEAAVADTALDTLANPYDQLPPDQLQLAQAPLVEEPAPPPQPLAPAAPPPQAPPQGPAPLAPAPTQRALDTEAPPPPPAARQAPPPPPGGLTFVERPDKDDEADLIRARQAEQKASERVLTHDTHLPVTSPHVIKDVKDIPRWQELQSIRGLYPGMTPKQQKDMEAQIVREENRLIAETNRRNAQAEKEYAVKHREELSKIDIPRESVEKQAETVSLVEQARQQVEMEYKKLMESGKPEDKHRGDYTLKTSPLGTMKAPEFSEAAAKLATYNGISPRQAISYAIVLGSPVNRNPQTGELQPGANKITGRGATAYEVIGKDSKNNLLVRMPDKVVIRVPATTFNQFAAVRDKGYQNDRAWWAARRQAFEDAGKDDWVTRQTKAAIGAVKERLQ